jgi:hypothetical protein
MLPELMSLYALPVTFSTVEGMASLILLAQGGLLSAKQKSEIAEAKSSIGKVRSFPQHG